MSSKSKSKATSFDVTPDTTILELLDKVIDGSVGTSQSQLLSIVKGLPCNENTEKLLVFCVMAAMNVKNSVDTGIKNSAVVVPSEMMVGDSINMSIFAQLGHIMMMASDSSFTGIGATKRQKYCESIGGAKNISDFTVFRDASSVRTTILKKYRETLSSYDHEAFRKVIAPKFTSMYNTSKLGFLKRFVGNSFSGLFGFFFNILYMTFIRPIIFICKISLWPFIIFSILNINATSKPLANAYYAFLGPDNDPNMDMNPVMYPTMLGLQILSNTGKSYYKGFLLAKGAYNPKDGIVDYFKEEGNEVLNSLSDRTKAAAFQMGIENGEVPMDSKNYLEKVSENISYYWEVVKDFFENPEEEEIPEKEEKPDNPVNDTLNTTFVKQDIEKVFGKFKEFSIPNEGDNINGSYVEILNPSEEEVVNEDREEEDL